MSLLTDEQVSPVDMKSRRKIAVKPGDVVRVYQKIVEKNKIRLQVFEGVVIARKHGSEAGATFTVRRVGSDGIVVEKIFPLYSPMIDRIEVIRRTRMRRSKLYFLRSKTPRQVREKLRRSTIVSESTTSETERAKQRAEVENIVEDTTGEEAMKNNVEATKTVDAQEAPTSEEATAAASDGGDSEMTDEGESKEPSKEQEEKTANKSE